MTVKLFGKEPALVGAFLSAVLSLVLGLGVVPGLNVETAGLITAAGTAVFGAYVAYAVKESLLPALVAAFQALVAVGLAFGLNDFLVERGQDPAELVGLVTALLVGFLGLFLRTQATPKAGSPSEPVPVPVVEVSNLGADDEEPVGDSDREALY